MARIVVIRHEEERRADFETFMIETISEFWKEAGHQLTIAYGCDDLPDADVAVLHVNRSVVPEEYVQASKRYPLTINGAATDIRKRKVSRNILERGDAWTGPVLVKTDLNFNGLPEWLGAKRAAGRGAPTLRVPTPRQYRLAHSIDQVPDRIWDDPALVVERFLPEYDGTSYFLRIWIFLGDNGRARRCRSLEPVVKAENVIDTEPEDVPEAIMAERNRLGFDYGKFDYVVHEGTPILLDANKTPGHRRGAPTGYLKFVAEGLDSLLPAATTAR